MSEQRKDPLPTFCFKVTLSIQGGPDMAAFFKSCGGLKMETEVVDYRAGGVNHSTYKLVGATKWPNLMLNKGFTGDATLMDWRKKWLDPNATSRQRATVTIEALDTQLQSKKTWVFVDAWPCKWEISEFDAAKNEIVIETLELAHHGLNSY